MHVVELKASRSLAPLSPFLSSGLYPRDGLLLEEGALDEVLVGVQRGKGEEDETDDHLQADDALVSSWGSAPLGPRKMSIGCLLGAVWSPE